MAGLKLAAREVLAVLGRVLCGKIQQSVNQNYDSFNN